MPYKKNDRNKNDAIHPNNVTGYILLAQEIKDILFQEKGK